MKPKRVVLCVGMDEDKLALRAFLLETHGYRVIRARNMREALDLMGLEQKWSHGVDVLLVDLPMPDVQEALAPARRIICPEMRSLVTGEDAVREAPHADVLLPDGSNAQLLERLRVLVVRKTRPKKPSGRVWMEERKKGVA